MTSRAWSIGELSRTRLKRPRHSVGSPWPCGAPTPASLSSVDTPVRILSEVFPGNMEWFARLFVSLLVQMARAEETETDQDVHKYLQSHTQVRVVRGRGRGWGWGWG